jgi:hypothetical protein
MRLFRSPSTANRTLPAWTAARRLRWCVRAVLGVPLIVAVAALLLMRSPLVEWVVASRVRSITSAELHARRAVIELDGRLTLRDMSLRLPGIDGPAGELISAPSASLDVDWSGWWRGSVTPRSLRLVQPVFRLAQSLEDGSINIAALTAARSAGGPGGAGITPPQVDALDARLEFGEFAPKAGLYRSLKTLRVAGSFTPIVAGSGGAPVYRILFGEVGTPAAAAGAGDAPVAGPRGMILEGRLDLSTAETELKLSNLALDAFPPESVPTTFRDLWRRLNIQGRVTQVRFTNTPAAGFALEAKLDGVSMDALVPVDIETSAGQRTVDRDLSLRDVSGDITLRPSGLRAELSARVREQGGKSRVLLETFGTRRDAALRCEIMGTGLNVSKDPEFLPYVPARVKYYLDIFSGPTAEVDARVVISRGEPTLAGPSEFRVSEGRLTFVRGRAAFAKFPYPFADMSGTVDFDDTKITMVKIEGRGPTGAKLTADGVISPLTDTARADVNVRVTDVPIDVHLLSAMPPDRKQILDAMLSRASYERLVGEGLIVPAERREVDAAALRSARAQLAGAPPLEPGSPPEVVESRRALESEVQRLERLEAVPAFRFGGPAEITVHVHRPEGLEVDWSTRIGVKFAEVGLVPEVFPLPIVARNVELSITDERAVLEAGEFAGLAGGSATLEAEILFEDGGKRTVRPTVRIAASGVPVDALLLAAVPDGGPEQAENAEPSTRSAKDILRNLSVRGEVDCTAVITAGGGEGTPVEYSVSVGLDRIRARPAVGPNPALEIGDLSGAVEVTPGSVVVRGLKGTLARLDAPGEPTSAFAIDLRAEPSVPGRRGGRVRANIDVDGLDLGAPLDQLAAVFSADAAGFLAGVREQRSPTGRLDGSIGVVHDDAGPVPVTRVSLEARGARDLTLRTMDGTIEIDNPAGRVEVRVDGATALRLDSASARLRFGGEPVGEVRASGVVTLAPGATGVRRPADLDAMLRDWRFESPLAKALVQRLGDDDARDAYLRVDPAGSFDAEVRLSGEGEIDATLPVVSGWIAPRSLGANVRGKRLELARLDGRVGFQSLPERRGVRGTIERVAATGPGWRAAGDGTWSFADGEGFGLDATLDLSVKPGGIDPPLLALAPAGLSRALEKLEAKAEGGLELRGARIVLERQGDPERASAKFDGTLAFDGLSATVGVPIRDASGSMHVRLDDPKGPAPMDLRVGLRAPTLVAGGVSLAEAEGEFATVDGGGFSVDRFTASCYGGRVSLTARVDHSGGEARDRYEAELALAGVRFAPVLRDLMGEATGPNDATQEGEAPVLDADATRGEVDATLSLAGIVGDASTRVGHGALRIANGDVVRLPVVMPLLQVSNLQLPSGDRFNYVQSTVSIAGETVTFDRVAVLSRSIAIIGGGTLRWAETPEDRLLDMRFNSKSTSRVPVWSDLFEAVRDEVLSTTVTGRLDAPVVRTEPLTTTRSVLGAIFSPGKDQARAAGAAAEAEARRERRRIDAAPAQKPVGPVGGDPVSGVTPGGERP